MNNELMNYKLQIIQKDKLILNYSKNLEEQKNKNEILYKNLSLKEKEIII